MDIKNEILRLIFKERYGKRIKDTFGKIKEVVRPRMPQNKVLIYAIDLDGKKYLLQESKNLVVYRGREWVAERLFNKDNGSLIDSPPLASHAIYWLGVGSGGASGDPLVPVPPTNDDTNLGDESPISSDATTSIYADYHDKDGTDYWFKHPFDGGTVEFEQDPNNDNKYLIVKATTTLANEECNFPAYNDLSEAGLFVSSSGAAMSAGPWNLFARVTFSTIQKTATRSLVFTWYIYV